MKNTIVRIESIEISNLKNVLHGNVELSNPKKIGQASILGIYGQNGSGKTSLINAMALLKHLLMGTRIPKEFADLIYVDASSFTIEYKINIYKKDSDELYTVYYSVSIRRSNNEDREYSVEVFDEKIAFSKTKDSKSILSKAVWMDTSKSKDTFGPKLKYELLTKNNKEIITDIIVARKLAASTSRSFLFSKELYNLLFKDIDNEFDYIMNILSDYGKIGLYVLDNKNSALLSLNALPLSFKLQTSTGGAAGSILIPIDGRTFIPKEAMDLVQKVIENMNIVLKQLVPGLTIGIHSLGDEMKEDGAIASRIQLLSLKNGKAIPLQYESDGIKKIVSILQLLIVVYNQPSITVAIDELDNGIFEYLLGELLNIISNKGKGQLIFTSHNLRPLETLEKTSIVFTTTNPLNRYIRFVNIKTNNNLRDYYYRNIILDEQTENIYNPTDNHEIALAFKDAGESYNA